MSLLEIFILAVGLSMDAAAVSISNTLCINKIKPKLALKMAGSFGLFQGIMPLIGYFAAMSFSKYITSLDHWIALILLGFIGGKMITESFSADNEENCSTFALTSKMLIMQSIATSIDALAVGVSLSALKVDIIPAVLLIGVITFLCCTLAVSIAKRFGEKLGQRAGLVGGIILILIGLKIFIEHVFIA